MREIISSIDIGSNSIKLVVGEFFGKRLHILSASKVETKGIERGRIVDEKSVVESIEEAIQDTEKMLGAKIQKCVLGINMLSSRINKSANAITIKSEDHIITSNDVQNLISKCADGKVPEDYVLVSVLPIEFTIDGDKKVTHPVGETSENLGLKAVVVSSPKDYVSDLLDIVNKAGLKVLDVVPNAVSDYYAFATKTTEETDGAIVNLGSQNCTVSIFEHSVLTNTATFKNGGSYVINDISYITKIDEADAKAIYKDIVLASSHLANPNEYRIVKTFENEEIKLDQYEMSEIASSRIVEILNLVKKQINILTKREISYIIVSGGLTELRDFNFVLSDVFGREASIGKLNLIGARDNSFSSTVGALKLYKERLELRGKFVSILSQDDLDDMTRGEREENSNGNTLLSKVFGYFFDN